MPKVEIYHAPMCGACHQAMDYFNARGISFTAYEVRWDGNGWAESENARDMKRRCGAGIDFVPQIFINDRHLKGWKTLSALTESGEIEALLRD
jgi:glutaredoxin 3